MDAQDSAGDTALLLASFWDRVEAVTLLLDAGQYIGKYTEIKSHLHSMNSVLCHIFLLGHFLITIYQTCK